MKRPTTPKPVEPVEQEAAAVPEESEDEAGDVLLGATEGLEPDEEQPQEDNEETEAEAQVPDAAGKGVAPAKTQSFREGTEADKQAGNAPPTAAGTVKGTILGDYRLLKKLGAGGMGMVFQAHQISLDRTVAVKVLPRELAAKNPVLVQRFLREARAMARLDHPNILRCHGVDQVGGLHFLSMDYIDGGNLQSWMSKLGKLSIGDALHITLAVAHGLQHAHEQNLIHRDIKPLNILLTKTGVVKIADLGLAKALDEDMDLTRTGKGAGTPLYMSPEQTRDVKRVDHRSDIYALGCMLYGMLTGRVPFEGETVPEVLDKKEAGKFAPARKFDASVPTQLDLILDKMLAPKPEHRFQNCAEVIAAVEGLGLAHETLSFLGKTAVKPVPQHPFPGTAKTSAPAKPAKSVMRSVTEVEQPPEDQWYVVLGQGENEIIQRMNTKQLKLVIKNGSVTNSTKVSRTFKGRYQPLATFREFHDLLVAHKHQEKANKKGFALNEFYQKIEKQEKRRQRLHWWYNLYMRMGGFAKLIFWVAVLVAGAIGGYFLVKWGLGELTAYLKFRGWI